MKKNLTKAKLSESQIQSSIIDWLSSMESRGLLFYERRNNGAIFQPIKKVGALMLGRFRSAAKGSKRGSPDISVLTMFSDGRTRVVYLEVKSDSGKQEPEQIAYEANVKKFGAEYYVVRSLGEAQKKLAEEPL